MKHLKIGPDDDAIYPITWVVENIPNCKIDRNYKDDVECVVGVALFVRLPESTSWAGYSANEDGWLYVCDAVGVDIDNLPEIPTMDGIFEVENAVNTWYASSV